MSLEVPGNLFESVELYSTVISDRGYLPYQTGVFRKGIENKIQSIPFVSNEGSPHPAFQQ